MTTEKGFALFDTALGRCGIAWGKSGIVAIQLPETRASAMRARLLLRHPSARETAPPRAVKRALAGIVSLLEGKARDLSDIVLDMEGLPEFHRRVYVAARGIPPGSTLSYGEVARRVGSPKSARAVGQALGRNPFAIVVPCHRVLAAGGKVGGFSADGGTTTKLRMLAIEGASAKPSDPPARRRRGGDDRIDRDRSGLSIDVGAAVKHLRSSDAMLARLIDAVGDCDMEVRKTSSVFVALSRAIVYQQLNGKAAEAIFTRVCALFPGALRGLTAERLLRVPNAKLRGAGLSLAKTLAMKDLARKMTDGVIPTLAEIRRMNDEEIVQRLTEVRGIGRWTVEMLLMFRLGRPDVLPTGDYGVRKGFAITFKRQALPTPAQLEQRAERWRPHRTVASWYLWRAVEQAKS